MIKEKPKFKINDKVLYTPIIGREPDGKVYTIWHVGKIPSCDEFVYWLKDKAGCVSEKGLIKWKEQESGC